MPKIWNQAVLLSIHKRDRTELHSCRNIAALNISYKTLETCLKNLLILSVDSQIGKYQCGF